MKIDWNMKPADRYGNSDTEYHANIGGCRGDTYTYSIHLSITKGREYIAKIDYCNMMAHPFTRHVREEAFFTLKQAKTWCEITVDELIN